MKFDERDPLAALRDAWAGLEPRELPDEPTDAVTVAVRAELRRAWHRLEPPATVLPPRLRRTPSRGAAWPAAVAAAVLVAFGALLWRGGGPPTLPAESPVAAVPSEGPRIAAVTAERLELTSGNVRLVLLTQNTAPASGVASGEEPR